MTPRVATHLVEYNALLPTEDVVVVAVLAQSANNMISPQILQCGQQSSS